MFAFAITGSELFKLIEPGDPNLLFVGYRMASAPLIGAGMVEI